jgi:hypothetical protein
MHASMHRCELARNAQQLPWKTFAKQQGNAKAYIPECLESRVPLSIAVVIHELDLYSSFRAAV